VLKWQGVGTLPNSNAVLYITSHIMWLRCFCMWWIFPRCFTFETISKNLWHLQVVTYKPVNDRCRLLLTGCLSCCTSVEELWGYWAWRISGIKIITAKVWVTIQYNTIQYITMKYNLRSIIFFRKSCRLWSNVENYCTSSYRWQYNTERALFMLDN
jgi:hypothetical protein